MSLVVPLYLSRHDLKKACCIRPWNAETVNGRCMPYRSAGVCLRSRKRSRAISLNAQKSLSSVDAAADRDVAKSWSTISAGYGEPQKGRSIPTSPLCVRAVLVLRKLRCDCAAIKAERVKWDVRTTVPKRWQIPFSHSSNNGTNCIAPLSSERRTVGEWRARPP